MKKLTPLLLLFVILVCLISTVDSSAQTGFLYVLNMQNGAANQIYGYSVDETTGALTALAGFPVLTGGTGTNNTLSELITIDRLNNRLFAVNIRSSTVSAFSINPASGALTTLPFSRFTVPGAGLYASIAVHPSGSPLIVSDASNARTISFVITTTTATTAAGSPFNTNYFTAPISSAFSRDGNYFYNGSESDQLFAGFGVNAGNGVLTLLSDSLFDSGAIVPTGLSTDAQGRIFLVGLSQIN